MHKPNSENQSGVILILSLFVLSIALVISLSFAAVFLKELKLSRAIVQSTVAFYAADAGVEYALSIDRKTPGGLTEGAYPGASLTNTASYQYTVSGTSPGRVIKSIGSFGTVQRSLEARY
ncbi:MAG: hypothetical protein A2666_00105 [Parcubacteria group bacterium RIFCSPHIGHO2_01_FULL_47_10b]|nr:MAG: hypothetical protein A2666_00105 [Parcubacteria group bacterium RIFCSPHIGHO2_01_FULL_47_10b]